MLSRIKRVLVLSLLVLMTASVAAAAELQIAVLPVLDETGGWLDQERAAGLQRLLYEETRIPLNDCLQIASYETGEKLLPVLERLEAEQRAQTGKKRIDDKLLAPKLAEALNADLVVYLRVKSYYQRLYHSFEHGMQIETLVDLRLNGYDRRAGRLIHENVTRHVRDDYSLNNTAAAQAEDALYYLLGRAQLKSAIFPLAEKK